MLVNFTVENWTSYKDEASLSLVSSRERQHNETLFSLPGFRSKKVLPAAAIYGGNASGKTNMFKAIACLQSMVVMPVGVDALIPVNSFALDKESIKKPTAFDITFLMEETVYRLIVEATAHEVVYESLEIVKDKDTFAEIYERDVHSEEQMVINPDYFEDLERTTFVFEGTRDNQLFINNAIQQNITELSPVYRWFSEVLDMVGVESQAISFARCCTQRDGFVDFAAQTLAKLDTGIVGLVTETVDTGVLPSFGITQRDVAQLPEGRLLVSVGNRQSDYGFDMLTVQRVNGEVKVDRLRTEHVGSDGKRIRFELFQESSGTQRLMQLLPMLYDLTQDSSITDRVYIVDELDRCLHTMLTSFLVQEFLSGCSNKTRKQLLFTTHDLLLMDQKLMRRDEMYIAQRKTDGSSELVALSEYEGIRFDKDLIRSYLDGRFGGIPMFKEIGVSCRE